MGKNRGLSCSAMEEWILEPEGLSLSISKQKNEHQMVSVVGHTYGGEGTLVERFREA
ncbi:hypothetical protein D1872_176420 [compost metagenome]